MGRIKLGAGVIAAVTGLSVVLGMRERNAQAVDSYVTPATVSAAPVVVTAKRPGLSEILDLVLHERPTAEEMTGKPSAGEFPAGSDEAYIAGVLAKYNKDRSTVERISAALVKEGRRRHIGTQLLIGILLTENPWLDPKASSSVGARGLMQVMPFHAGKWGCGSRDLVDIESNICHGVAVLADNLERSPSLRKALLGYNGCVRGTNTPDCWRYPSHVYRRGKLGVN